MASLRVFLLKLVIIGLSLLFCAEMAGIREMFQDAQMTCDGFIREFKQRHDRRHDQPFCFILGAGASKTSGIPTGGELASAWLNELYQDGNHKGQTLAQWVAEGGPQIEGFNIDNPAEFYPQLYARRFRNDPDNGYACLEAAMENAVPRYGYYALANILAETRHKIAITTNFDNLLADALSVCSLRPPLICGHESLAIYARVNLRRPLIAKIHNDLLLDPKSQPDDVSFLATEWQTALARIFRAYTPVVIGYGGNDGSLMGFLSAVRYIPGGIFWCYHQSSEPSPAIVKLVHKHHGRLIPIHGFDELMRQLSEALGLSDLTNVIESRFDMRKASFVSDLQELVQKGDLKKLPREAKGESGARIGNAPSRSSGKHEQKQQRNAFKWLSLAQFAPNDQEREKILLEALKEYPHDALLLGRLALLCHYRPDRAEDAEKYYRRAVDADPQHSMNLGNFANFLTRQRRQHDEAEKYYRRAIEADPLHASNLGNFASFLTDQRGRHDEAEQYYRRAIEADPKHVTNLGNFATFLTDQRGQHDEAEQYYRRSIEANPKNAVNLGNFAFFLSNQRGRCDEAEQYYRRAIEADPKSVSNLGNYAVFLANQRGRKDEAEQYLRRTIDAAPKDAAALGNLASFLTTEKGLHDEAEQYYRRAIDVDPRHAANLGNFAAFLTLVRGQHAEAEKFYRQSIDANPKMSSNLGNFAQLLLGVGRPAESISYARQAWETRPDVATQEHGEVLLCIYLASLFLKGTVVAGALARLKAFLGTAYFRKAWSFSTMLQQAKERLDEQQYLFVEALAGAILEAERVDNLSRFAQWMQLQPILLGAPWPELLEQSLPSGSLN